MAAVMSHFAVVFNSMIFKGCEKDAIKENCIPPARLARGDAGAWWTCFLLRFVQTPQEAHDLYQHRKCWTDLHRKSNSFQPFAASLGLKDLNFCTAMTNDQGSTAWSAVGWAQGIQKGFNSHRFGPERAGPSLQTPPGSKWLSWGQSREGRCVPSCHQC